MLFVFTQEINPRAIEYTFITLVLYQICTALDFSLDSIILTTTLRGNLHAIPQQTREKLLKYEYLLENMLQTSVLKKKQAHIFQTKHFFP